MPSSTPRRFIVGKQKKSRILTKPCIIEYDGQIVGYGSKELRVETIPCWLARIVIASKHYSRRFVNNSYLHLGVFCGRDLVGVLQFGYALNPNSGRRVVLDTDNRGYMELNRMWLHDDMPRNSESRAISYSLKTIKLLHPSVEWVQSFADERCGKSGVVYQASNFDFIGSHETTFYELDGDWYHEIAMNAIKRGGKRGEFLRANKERAVVHKFRQFRYIRFLNKRARKRLNSKFFRIQPYPKSEHSGQ
ncbi:protein mom [Salmonella enterica]|uniref:Protein mom n=1 Tax=Salmonella enterica TaxID=28901 RepID=A0A5T6U0M0_SALER|nr:protein mom [Salmonella enterica]EBE4286479.1 protein mom [Salmonella enterica subsp. enterica]ECS8495323.1 protein mom [Salmonella enterica subsp. enterica serovar Give]ECX3454599.1 protein mom [Salmonella enterica subsp. enterica serovar Rubislaw]ECZ3640506.1 protein mom [Salmonella enterica subsp. enterica serovar Montevideo]EDI1470968.1 protein mom [Salmonella enterica subsp. enterica serovar Newport]EDS7169472.1 protein mom [Salmonella enterica subsp. enterica serovar Florida]EDX9198